MFAGMHQSYVCVCMRGCVRARVCAYMRISYYDVAQVVIHVAWSVTPRPKLGRGVDEEEGSLLTSNEEGEGDAEVELNEVIHY